MNQSQIRSIAICLFWKEKNLLVAEGHDPCNREEFYRPLGGAIKLGEYGCDCVVREIREEFGAAIEDLTCVGLVESLFLFDGKLGHEIVLVFEASFVDRRMYDAAAMEGGEDDGTTFIVKWKSPVEFKDERARSVPEGLLDLLEKGKVLTG